MAHDSKQLAADLNMILGTDLEIPGRGIGLTLARKAASWLTHLLQADTSPAVQALCKPPVFRDSRVAESLWTHRDAVVACMEQAGVSPF